MARKMYILLLVTIGLLIGPQSAMGHHTETTKVCCKNTSSTKSCCSNQKEATQKKHACEGNCKSVSCACPSIYVTSSLVFYETDNRALFSFLKQQQQNYFYLESNPSNDCPSIWLPPKIS